MIRKFMQNNCFTTKNRIKTQEFLKQNKSKKTQTPIGKTIKNRTKQQKTQSKTKTIKKTKTKLKEQN